VKESNSIFYRITACIYDSLDRSRMSNLYFPKTVQRDVKKLGQDRRTYYIRKLQYTIGLLLLGILFVVLYVVYGVLDRGLPITGLRRPEAYQEPQVYTLQIDEESQLYEIEVSPIEWTLEEAEGKFREAAELMKREILGNNGDLENITEDLVLSERLEGYPFEIYWTSDRKDIVSMDGKVNREGLKEDTVVVLTAEFCYREWTWQEQFGVLICREVLTEEEEHVRGLSSWLAEYEKENRQKQNLKLPENYNGKLLKYHLMEKDYTWLWLALLATGAGMLLWFGQDMDLRSACKKRQNLFREEYATLVNSLSLYISAGMTLQGAMLCCVRDYTKRKEEGHVVRNALEDFQKNLQNGYSFSAAITQFAETSDDAEYRKLAGIMIQGLINGAVGMAELLEQEAEQANEEKRRHSKVKGEQISTALIAPMMLQLGIVIALVMLPAFDSLQF